MNISLLNLDIFGDVTRAIKSWFFGVLYAILKALLYIVDICEALVRKLAGIDSFYYNGQLIDGSTNNDTVTGDIIEIILRTDIVRNLFLSLLVLGIILLFIVTFVSIWKTEWNFEKEGNSKTKILNSALKSLFNFIAVPVIAFFGIFVGNALLRAIDSATRGGESQTFSAFVMSSAFANACKESGSWVSINKNSSINVGTEENPVYKKGILSYFTDSEGKLHTDEVVKAFQSGTTMPKGEYVIVDENGSARYFDVYNEQLDNGTFVFSYDDATLVTAFFDNTKINYLPLYLIMVFIIKAMLTITFGLIKRLYYVVILFVISPPIVAMAPINGKALDEWKKMFVGSVCSAFITIAIYNIFLSIYPMFQNITLFSSGSSSFYSLENFFVQLLFIAVGLQAIAGLSSEISKVFGIKDVYGDSTDKGKSLWGGAFGLAGSALRPVTAPLGAIGKAGKFMTTARYHGLGEAAKDLKAGAKGAYDKTVLKNFTDGAKVSDVKSLGSARKFKKEAGILDQYNTIKATNKSARNDLKLASEDLKGMNLALPNNYGDMAKKLSNNKEYQKYANSLAIDEKYKHQWKNLNGDQRKEKLQAKANLKQLSDEQLKQLSATQKFLDAYDIASKTGGNAFGRQFRQKGAVGLMQKEQLKKNLGENNQIKNNSTKEAIERQIAKNDARVEQEQKIANQKQAVKVKETEKNQKNIEKKQKELEKNQKEIKENQKNIEKKLDNSNKK